MRSPLSKHRLWMESRMGSLVGMAADKSQLQPSLVFVCLYTAIKEHLCRSSTSATNPAFPMQL